MHNEIDIVEQNPLSLLVAFDMERTDTFLAEPLFNTFGDRLTVTAGGCGADYEVVGECANFIEIDDNDILRFLVECGF